MIRERGMIPGLSTHMPEAIPYTDNNGYDIETYIQIYNAAGFLMQVEADWVMRVIRNAAKLARLIEISECVVAGALAREESRGAHLRRDVPHADDRWQQHTIARRGADGRSLHIKRHSS